MRRSSSSAHPPAIAGRARRARGFTLVEIIAVVALIALATTLVAVSVGTGLEGARIRAAGKELAAALRYTRTQAIVKRESQALLIDVHQRSYQAPGRRPVTLPSGLEVKLLTAAEEMTDEGVGGIRFFPDGASTGGHVELLREGAGWRIDIAWLTGEVRIVPIEAGG